ncbi:MAG: amidohydrolase [Acidobacteria bacterium]|nr:MAG: amidohydrolase [Acidobacteriota bacterium]
MKRLFFFLCVFLILPTASFAQTQTTPDPELLAAINRIRAIDNHAHPLKFTAEGEKADAEYDALPLDSIEPFELPVRLNLANPEFIGAWRQLFDYKYSDMLPAHVEGLVAIKQHVLKEKGTSYPAWVLDRLNIDTMFANRVAMGTGLVAPHFRWVSFVDALLFPLSNATAKKASPDYAGFYPAEEKLLQRYMADLKVSQLPPSLTEYINQIVIPTLERQKREGVVALKFEAAYLRSLDFAPADEKIASQTYANFIKGGEPPAAAYKTLQDYLFHKIAEEAGRLGLAIHIHSIDGAGGYYRQSNSNPSLLESTFNDPSLRKTNFVLIHGGYPFTKQTAALIGKPNVYADFSAQTFLLYPRALSEVLRNWLENYPDKVLFGTDAFAFTPAVDWPETAWLSNTSARQGLALALTAMMNDGEITRARALELANLVMRENARKLYHLP